MNEILYFCLLVGIGSTVILDLWVTIVEKVLGIPPTDWGLVGRWITGIPKGQWTLDTTNDAPPGGAEKTLGWLFHYIVGIAYAALILLFFGTGFIHHPTVMPIIVVGLILSTVAGLAILMPALGAGFIGRLVPNWLAKFVYLLIAHAVFSVGQYGFSLLFLSFTG